MSQAKEFLSSLGMEEQKDELKRKREEEEIIPLHLRPRKLNFWDQRPKGYDKMSADQIKATGMFLLPSHLLKGTGKVEPVQPYGMIGYQQPVVVEKKSVTIQQYAMMKKIFESDLISGFNTKRLIITNLPECQQDDLIGWVNMTYDTYGWDKGPGLPGLSCAIDAEKHTAIVEFRSAEEATEALKLNGMEFMDTTITVLRPRDYRAGEEDPNYVPGVIGSIVADTTNKVFIGGIPTYVTDEQVMDLLKAFGTLKSFNLAKNDAGVSKGFAFCEYLDPDVTDIACEGLHGLELGDKKLIVQRAHTGMAKMPIMEGALPGAGLGRPILPIEILGANGLKAAEPTTVLMMANVFDPELVSKDDVYEDVLEDIRLECERFGTVEEVYIPRPKDGETLFLSGRAYCKYATEEECQKAQRALAGRKFLDRTVLTTFVDPYKFEARVL